MASIRASWIPGQDEFSPTKGYMGLGYSRGGWGSGLESDGAAHIHLDDCYYGVFSFSRCGFLGDCLEDSEISTRFVISLFGDSFL